MSIPTPFNPLGTLGANPLHGYVTDGLIFCIDMLAAGDGDAVTVRELVSGKAINTPVQINGGVTRSQLVVARSDFDIKISLYGRTQEIVCAKDSETEGRNLLGFCARNGYPLIGTRYDKGVFFTGKISSAALNGYTTGSNTLKTLSAYYIEGVDKAKAYINGIEPEVVDKTGAASYYLVSSSKYLAAVRVYDRVLTDDEILQNATMDALRWDKSIVYK